MHIMNNTKTLLTLLVLSLSLNLFSQEISWHNPMDEAIPILHGQGWQDELKGSYHRIPNRMEALLENNRTAWGQSKQCAGEKLVFRTNSETITIRYQTESKNYNMRHMPSTGVSGVDLYAVDENGKWTFCNTNFQYSFGDTIKYTFSGITYPTSANEKGYEFHLYLPLYNGLNWLEVGVKDGSFWRWEKPSLEKPIVIYGTSIAQGACASRPGMAWTNIVERTLQHPILNLGVSGSAKMEEPMQNLLNEVDASLFILDNMENMLAQDVYKTSLHCCRLLRENHPNTPILLVEHSGWPDQHISNHSANSVDEINAELQKVYQELQKNNTNDIYYLTKEELGLDTESFVEGIHPNDYGMMINAKSIIKKIKEIFKENASETFTPCTQNRDPYMWRERHEDILKLNKEEKPDVVLIGNSITHYWGGKPTAHIIRGQEAWEKMSEGVIVHNLGFGWDRIENGLWRIYHGELDGYEAKKVFLLLGTNNVVKNTDQEIARGILELVQAVKDRQPKAKIYVCGIMPRHGWGPRVLEINKYLQENLKLYPEITYIPFDTLGDSEGVLLEEYWHDGTHPNAKGYEAEGKILREYIVK